MRKAGREVLRMVADFQSPESLRSLVGESKSEHTFGSVGQRDEFRITLNESVPQLNLSGA